MNARELQRAKDNRDQVDTPFGRGTVHLARPQYSQVYVPERARVITVFNGQISPVDIGLEAELERMALAAEREQAERDAYVWPTGGIGFDLE